MPNSDSPSSLLDGAPAPAMRLPDLSRKMIQNSSSSSPMDKKLLSILRPIMPFSGTSRHVDLGYTIRKRHLSSRFSMKSEESGYLSQTTLGEASSYNPTALNTPKLLHTYAMRERKEAEVQQRLNLEHYLQEFCQQLRSDLRLGLSHEEANSIQENKIKYYQSHLKETIEKKLKSYNAYFYSLGEIKVISELFSLLSTLQVIQKLSHDLSLPKLSCGFSFSKNSKKKSDKRIIKIIADDLKKSEKLAKKNANKLLDDFHCCMTRLPRIQEDIVELILPKNCYANTFCLLESWLTEFALSLKKGDFTDSKIFYNTLKRLKRAREAASEVNENLSESNGSITSQTNFSFKSQGSAHDSVYGSAEKIDNADTDEHRRSPLGMSFFFKPVCSATKSSAAKEVNIVSPTLNRSISI